MKTDRERPVSHYTRTAIAANVSPNIFELKRVSEKYLE